MALTLEIAKEGCAEFGSGHDPFIVAVTAGTVPMRARDGVCPHAGSEQGSGDSPRPIQRGDSPRNPYLPMTRCRLPVIACSPTSFPQRILPWTAPSAPIVTSALLQPNAACSASAFFE